MPDGVQQHLLGRQSSQVTLALEATTQATVGAFDIYVETEIDGRKVPSPLIALSVEDSKSP
jgi:hypothetical protein